MPYVSRKSNVTEDVTEETEETEETAVEEVSTDQDPLAAEDPRRSARIVRVRHLNTGPHPTAGVTISHADLRLAGLDIGSKVYILVETIGRIVIEKVSWQVQRSRRPSREARPVMLRPAERQELGEVLQGVIQNLEMSALEDEQGGRRPRARSKFNRVDRLRYLGRKLR